jgi:multiple sugar transport system ATP-binding protein
VYARPANLFVATFLGSPAMNLLNGALSAQGDGVRFTGAKLELDVSRYPFIARPDFGKPCVLGVRPEDVRVRIGADSNQRGQISLIEPMGNHRVIWLDYHGMQIASIDQEKTPVAVGDSVAFTIDDAHISLFDEAGGERL